MDEGTRGSREARQRWQWRNIAVIALMVASLSACASGVGPRELTGMPTSRDVAPTPEAQRLLGEATTDYKRVLAGDYPMYAKFKGAPRVGTRIYTNTGYSIEDSPLLLPGDDRMFHQSGVTLTLLPPITATAVSYRDVRLVRRSLVPVTE